MQRITSIDSLRGMLMCLITFNHLIILPFISVFHLSVYTYGSLGYFTAAEGFYFLSGLVTGLVYGRMFLEGRASQAASRIYTRVKELYLWEIALFLGVALFFFFSTIYVQNWNVLQEFHWKGKEGVRFLIDHPLQAWGLACFFLYLPSFFDLLPMYVFFLVIAPFVLRQIHQDRLRLVLLSSFSLWAIAQFIPPRILESTFKSILPPVKLGWFDLSAWQLLFFSGLVFGYLKAAGRLPKPARLLGIAAPLFALCCFVMKHWGPTLPNATSLYTLGPLRLLNFAAIACTVWTWNRYLSFRPFAFLGKYALQVFIYHVAMIYFLIFFLDEITALSFPIKFLLLLTCIVSLWLPALYCERRKKTLAAVQ